MSIFQLPKKGVEALTKVVFKELRDVFMTVENGGDFVENVRNDVEVIGIVERGHWLITSLLKGHNHVVGV